MQKLYNSKGGKVTFEESVYQYLKPQTSHQTRFHFLMVLVDTVISCVFIACILVHIIEDKFSTLNDKVIECIIGIGLTAIVTLYSFMDGSRFI